MKAKQKATAEAGGAEAGLAREDWDFDSCPPEREVDCWLYEYARESQEIVSEYRQCKEHPCAGYAVDPSFDENGNWSRTIDVLDENGDLDEQIRVEVSPGFPEMPYLKTKHVPVKYDGEELDIDSFTAPVVRDAGRWRTTCPSRRRTISPISTSGGRQRTRSS